MFHRRQRDQDEIQRRHFWSRVPRAPMPPYAANGPSVYPGTHNVYYRNPYVEGSTRSDWDHYAVRHEEALIGDPLPIMNNGLNLAAQPYGSTATGPYGQGPLGRGPLNHGYDDSHYSKRHPVPTGYDRYGNPLIGPVTANGPLAGNYSSGTVVERNLVQGPGRRTRTGFIDENNHRQYGSTAWGAEPLYGPGPMASGFGAEPLWGYRDARDRATPLLPDNPWTHNELGRDYADAYRYGTMPYSSINNAFVAPPIQESFVNYGPNGERIEGTRTRVIREEIVPAVGVLGQQSTTTTTKTVKDEVIPTTHHHKHDVIAVQKGVLVEDKITPIGSNAALVTETQTPVTVVLEK